MRGKKVKKLLTWLLCICLMMGMIPSSAFAAETQQQSENTSISQQSKTEETTTESKDSQKDQTDSKETTKEEASTESENKTTEKTTESKTTAKTTTKQKSKKQNSSNEVATQELIGDHAEITVAKLLDKKNGTIWGDGLITGSGDLDETKCWDGKTEKDRGYDNSSSNNIIRSFDSITYNVGTTIQMDKKAHKLNYEVTLPDDDELTLDESAMKADKISAPVKANGKKTYTCEYSLPADYAGGEKEINIIVKVGNKHQGYEIKPEFKAYLDSESDKAVTVNNVEKVIVTTAPMYNIVLKQKKEDNPTRNIYNFDQTSTSETTYYKDNAKDYKDYKVNGYERVFGFALEIKKDGKGGIKGVELPDPKEGISFDIDLSQATLTKPNEEDGTNMPSKGFKPLLYYTDYNRAGGGAVWNIPYTKYTNDQKGCYNSGNMTMTQDGTTLHVTVKDFEIDRTKFPKSNLGNDSYWQDLNEIIEGNFSAFQFHVVYPYINEKGQNLQTEIGDGTLNVKAEAKNMKAVSETKTEADTETTYEDNTQSASWSLNSGGKREQQIYYSKQSQWTDEYTNGQKWTDGDVAAAGTKDIAFTVAYDESNVGAAYPIEDVPVAIDQMVLFDRNALDDVTFNNSSAAGKGYSCKVLYAVSKTGRLTNEEMKTVKLDESQFDFYETKPEGGCDGVLLQYRGANTGNAHLELLAQCFAKVKPDVEADKVYMITAVTNSWTAKDLESKILKGTGKTSLSDLTHEELSAWAKKIKDPTGFVKDVDHTPSTIDPRNLYTVPVYTDGVYNVDGKHKSDVHWADGLYIVPYTTTVTKTVAQLDDNGNQRDRYNVSKGQRFADYKISSSMRYGDNVKVPDDATTTVYLEDTLPKGLTYIKGSAHWGGTYTSHFPQAGSVAGGKQIEPTISDGENGTTILKWKIENVKLQNGELPTLYYSCQIGDELHPEQDVEDNQTLKNTVTIQTDEDKRTIDEKVYNIATAGISVAREKEFYIVKRGGESLELQDTSSYELIAANTSSNAKDDLWMFDTLPYKGDGKSKQMDGSYKIKSLTMDQKAIKNATDIEVWYTNESKYIGKTAEDIQSPETEITETNGWHKAKEQSRDGNTITFTGDGLIGAWPTAIVYKDKFLESNSVADLKLTYEAVAGAKDDEFTNTWSTMSNGSEIASNVTTDVYNRTLEGTVWFDKDQNGKIDDGQTRLLKDVKVTLLKDDGTGNYVPYTPYNETKDGTTYTCPSTMNTDENGHYKFTGLPSGKYRVQFESSDGTKLGSYDVTEPNADEDITKTSKVEKDNVVKEDGKLESGTIDKITMPTLEQMVSKGQKTYNLPDQNLGLIIPKINIPVKKTWNDSDNRDGKRPSEIKVNLYADGTKIQTLTLDADHNWEGAFEGLPKYSEENLQDLKEIKYEVKEVTSVDGYENQVKENVAGDVTKGFTVTNTHTPEKIDIPVTKTWDDKDNQDGKRPTKIIVHLQKDNKDTGKKLKLTAENGWSGKFEGLEKYEEGQTGKEINYSVTEEKVNDYTNAVTGNVTKGFTVTNTHTPETINISGTKTWEDKDDQDGKRPSSVTIRLYANGKEVKGKTAQATADSDWKYSFTGLPKYENGKEIIYTVTEDKVENYTTTINGYNVTNKYEPGKVNISVTKAWDDANNQDGVRPESVKVHLYADGKDTGKELTLTADDNWSGSFTDLDEKSKGKAIEYTIKEDAVEGYTSNITGDAGKGYVVTNTHTPEVTTISGSKTWEDKDNQDGKRPEKITIRLLANGKEAASKTVTAADNWSWKFENLAKYNAGKEINYTVSEDKVEGYTTMINGYNVTNTHKPETVNISGSKTWEDKDNQDGVRPEKITIRLLANGKEAASKTVTAADNWSWKFENLAKYNAGTKIIYTVTEDAVEGYTATTNGYNVTNTHAPGKTSIAVTKAWEDANNQDGVRPESVKVHLYADGKDTGKELTLTAEDNWSGSFTDLDEKSKGKVIEYTIKEDDVEGYTSNITGDAGKGYVVTNTHTPEVTTISGSKTWDDKDNQDGKRPEKIMIRLLANGEEVANKEVTAADNWSWNFEDLAKYNAGEEIVYTVTEDAVKDYETIVNGYDVKNSYTPGKTSVTVTKSWKDKNNKYKKRPTKIKVHLYADGKDTGKTLTLTKSNNWSGSFKNLDEYKSGVKIKYTIKEDGVSNYISKITGDSKKGYVITNIYVPDKPGVPDDKNLKDKNGEDSSDGTKSSKSTDLGSESSKNGKTSGTNKSAKTGDTNAVLPWMIVCAASLGAVIVTYRRRRSQK